MSDEVRNRLYEVRNQLGLSQRAMSLQLGYSDSFYGKIESHQNMKISDRMLKAVCSTFDVRYDYLISGNLPMFNRSQADIKRIIQSYEQMTDTYKRIVREFIEFAYEKSKKEAESVAQDKPQELQN